jgi:hypothetical protein
MIVPQRKCWICGVNDATTDEHNFKRSDLIEHVGRPTPVQPLFYHDATGRKNVRLCGPDNPHLLHRKMLCAPCNNVLTQPHDLAWEKLSGFLARQHDATRFIAMRQVFGKRVQAELENLHLFFVKKLGCAIVRARDEFADPLPIALAPLAKAIRMGTPAPNVFLRLVCDAGEWNGGDNANAVLIENDIAWFEFCYLVGGRGVQIIFNDGLAWRGMRERWHPRYGAQTLRLVAYDKIEQERARLRTIRPLPVPARRSRVR